jgi:hypothetical protein
MWFTLLLTLILMVLAALFFTEDLFEKRAKSRRRLREKCHHDICPLGGGRYVCLKCGEIKNFKERG